MQLADVDWGLLRGATIVSFVSLAISGSLIFGGAKLASDAALEYSRDQQRYSSARQRYLTLDDEERLIREFAPQFGAARTGPHRRRAAAELGGNPSRCRRGAKTAEPSIRN